MFNFDRGGGRALTTFAGLILLVVGLANLGRVLSSGGGAGLVGVPLAVVAILLGGWIISSALSGVRIEPGIAVGGGPMLVRVALEPGEVVSVHGVGGAGLFVTGDGGDDATLLEVLLRFALSTGADRGSDVVWQDL